MAEARWVDVVVPVPVRTAFTYAWPLDREPEPGLRVFVPFGRNRVLLGVVVSVRTDAPDYAAKDVLRCVDERPSDNLGTRPLVISWHRTLSKSSE